MSLFQKDELKLLWPFYLDALLSPILYLAPPFYVIYFTGLGLTLTQVGILVAMTPLFALLFEIPTGAFADIYGRKKSVLLSFVLMGLGFGLFYILKNFYALLAVSAFLGFASSFASGAREAWSVDLMKNNKELVAKYSAKMQTIDSCALIISGFLGAFIVRQFGTSIIWPVTMLSFLVSVIVLLFAGEKRANSDLHAFHTLKQLKLQASTSAKYCLRHKALAGVMVAGMFVLFAANLAALISWTPFLKELGMPDYSFGYLWSILALATLLSGVASHKFLKQGREKQFIVKAVILAAAATGLAFFVKDAVVGLAVLGMSLFFISISRPAESALFHSFIPSKLRATIGSIQGMLFSIAGVVSIALAGLLVDSIGARYTIVLGALVMLPAAIIYNRLKVRQS